MKPKTLSQKQIQSLADDICLQFSNNEMLDFVLKQTSGYLEAVGPYNLSEISKEDLNGAVLIRAHDIFMEHFRQRPAQICTGGRGTEAESTGPNSIFEKD